MVSLFNNPSYSGLVSYYNEYMNCVDKSLTKYISESKTNKNESTAEWCKEEKHAYLEHMKEHYKDQYDNILRLESQNF